MAKGLSAHMCGAPGEALSRWAGPVAGSQVGGQSGEDRAKAVGNSNAGAGLGWMARGTQAVPYGGQAGDLQAPLFLAGFPSALRGDVSCVRHQPGRCGSSFLHTHPCFWPPALPS